MRLYLTCWPSLTATSGRRAEITREELLTWIRAPLETEAAKDSLAGFSLATFANDARGARNVEANYALVLDIDSGGLTAHAVAERLKDYRGIVYSSVSSTVEAPRNRVVLEVSRPILPHEYPHVWSTVAAWFRDVGIELDERTKDASRFWFVPAKRPGAPYDVIELQGQLLGVDGIVALARQQEPPAPSPPSAPDAPHARDDVSAARARRDAAVALLSSAWPATGRHGAQLALAGALYRTGYDRETALEILCDVCRRAGNEERTKREATIRATWARAERGEEIAGWGALASAIDPAVVHAARDLITGDGEGRAMLEGIGTKPAPRVEQPSIVAPGADHFSSRIKRGADWTEPYVRPPYLLDGLIPRSTVTTFFAEGGSVKSWALFALAISVATGAPWLGKYAVQPGNVLMLDYEDGWAEHLRRKELLLRLHPELAEALERLHYLYAGPQIVELDLWRYIAEQGFDLVTVDALSGAMPADSDENDQRFAAGLKVAGRVVEATTTSEHPLTVVAVHHANKTGTMRGASAIRDQSDVVFKFEPVSETASAKRMHMLCDKPGPQRRPLPVNLELSDEGLTSWEPDAGEVDDDTDAGITARIKSTLAQEPIVGIEELAERIGKRKDRILRLVRILKERGEIVKHDRYAPYFVGYIVELNGKRNYGASLARMRAVLTEPDGAPCATSEALAKRANVNRDAIEHALTAGAIVFSSSDPHDGFRRLMWVDHD